MCRVDDSFQNRISAEFAQMQAKLDAQALMLAALGDLVREAGHQQTRAVEGLAKALHELAEVMDVDDPEEPPATGLDGEELPPDRPEGQPL